jgi:hypothetical protein
MQLIAHNCFFDNIVAICLYKNAILHTRTKHIEVKHHFIRDCVQKEILDIKFIYTNYQWADTFTKPFIDDKFNFILKNLNVHFIQI